METREFFVNNLKKIYENCSIYFDIQERAIIVKNLITKKKKLKWDEEEPEFRKMRVRIREARNMGIINLPKSPPQHWKDICEDSKCKIEENYFYLMIDKLEQWEINQNKKVENVGLLIEFLEWFSDEEERLEKKAEELQEQKAKENLKEFLTSISEEMNELLKKLHPDFTEELKDRWEHYGFSFDECCEWVDSGLSPKDVVYATYLCGVFELSPQAYLEIDDNSKEEFRVCYRERFFERFKNINDIKEDEKIEEETMVDEFLRLSLEDDNLKEVRNILLIGRTGNGKSTLGNILVNKNDNFEEVFREGEGSVSETNCVQVERFSINLSSDGKEKVNYRVIDTAGFDDTQLDNKEILKLFQTLVPVIKKSGLNQIFFVIGGRFTREEMNVYNLLRKVIFDREASKYTTIVRTNFPEFENKEKREMDRSLLQEKNQEIFEILNVSRIVYVDNPPISEHYADIAKIARESSRMRLITCLGTCQNNYFPKDLENLNERISNYLTKEEELMGEIKKTERKIEEEQIKFQKEIEKIQFQKNRELKIIERNLERQIEELKEQNQRKLEIINQEYKEVLNLELKESCKKHDREINTVRKVIQDNLNQTKDNCIEVGNAVCRCGNDKSIKVYDKFGSLILDYQSDFIGHIYCPICDQNDCDYDLNNVERYTLEEWSKKNSQQVAEKRQKIQETIDEWSKKEKEMIDKIEKEKISRELKTIEKTREEEKIEREIIEQQNKINEERANSEKLAKEGEANLINEKKINKLRKELENKKKELFEYLRKAEEEKKSAEQKLFSYIEQKLS